jgi:hypothetical protein
MLALLFLAAALANIYHYDGKVLNHPAIVNAEITKSEMNFAVDVSPYVNITCAHKRTLEKFPCYKWIKLDMDSEKCLHSLKGEIQEIKLWFDHETLKVSAKHYVTLTYEAKAIEHSDKDICAR